MLLQKPESIFNEYHSPRMDKHVTKKQRLFLKHLQQPSTDDLPPSLEKTLNKESNCLLNGKTNKTKKKAKNANKITPLVKRRLQRECLAKRATVVLNKIENCPDVNSVWTYDPSVGKYRWASSEIDVATSSGDEDTEVETDLPDYAEEMCFVITEVRGNASDVFGNVSTSSDIETAVKMEYNENTETEVDVEEIVEAHKGYDPAFQDHDISLQVDEKEMVEKALEYEIEPKEPKSDSEGNFEDNSSDHENTSAAPLRDSHHDSMSDEKSVSEERWPLNKRISGNAKRKRKKCLKKTIIESEKSIPLRFNKPGDKRKTDWRSYSLGKEKRIARVGKHSKIFRSILKSVPPYWRSRNSFSTKKFSGKIRTDEERKSTIPLKQRLLRFPQDTKEDVFHVADRNSENTTPPKTLDKSEKSMKLRLKRKKYKSSKGSKEGSNSSQANVSDPLQKNENGDGMVCQTTSNLSVDIGKTHSVSAEGAGLIESCNGLEACPDSEDGSAAKRKSEKQDKTSNSGTPDDGYSLLDQELPGYNWLEKKIKSGELNSSRRDSTASQENNLTIQESLDKDNCSAEQRTEVPATVQAQDTANDKLPQEDIVKPANNEETQKEEAPNENPPDTKLSPSAGKEQQEITSPESGVEIDVVPLSADDSEGDFLAQGVYLVIDESQINSGNDSYVDNASSDLTEKKKSKMEDRRGKTQIGPSEDTSNESQSRSEHDHICNNEECLLSAPERLKIANRNNVPCALDIPISSSSWLKDASLAELQPEEKNDEIGVTFANSPAKNSLSTNATGKIATNEELLLSKRIKLEESNGTRSSCTSFNQEPTVHDSNISCSQHQTTAIAENNEVKMKDASHTASVNCPRDYLDDDRRVTRPSHIPVQQICKTSVTAVARRSDTSTQSTLNSRGKFEGALNMPRMPSAENLPVKPLQAARASLAGTAVSLSNSSYTQPPQEVRTHCMRGYEQYFSPSSWSSQNSSQGVYEANIKGVMQSQCQVTEHQPPNFSAQNEKNFTISSLLELQSVSSQSLSMSQANIRTETTVSTEVQPTTSIHRTQPNSTPSSVNNVIEQSALRSQLEGNLQRPKLPEAPKPDVDEDSTDDIKIIYNKVTSYKTQPVSTHSNSQPQDSVKEKANYLPSVSQTSSPCLIYQDHVITPAVADRTEQQVPLASSITPLPIMPKPIPMQPPLRPSPVLVSPVMENVEQQRIYPVPPAETLQPLKETYSPETENISPGFQTISSYHAPPKSLREEVEYRKRELMYLDQLARKREKEFERLQNIRKSKIRLLRLLENRMPIALNKDCNTQKAVPYYFCAQPEKPLSSEGWTGQPNTHVMPPEMPSCSVVQPTPATRTSPHVSSLCNSYHYPPPNDRIRYELNSFMASFNNQMQERTKDTDSVINKRKEHDASFSREQRFQNSSTIPPSSVPAYGMPQSASAVAANVARVIPITQGKSRAMEASPATAMAPSHLEKGINCQTHYPAGSIPPPPPYNAMTTKSNSCSTVPVQQNYPNCQYQNSKSYDSLYPGSHQNVVAPPPRVYEQQSDSSQSHGLNSHMEPRYKEGAMTENAQHHYGNKVWADQANWPKHNTQKMPTNYQPHFQPEARMPSTFWPVANPPDNTFNSTQRLRFQPNVVQPRIEDSSIGLMFVDASKTAHQCNFCSRNAIFLCSSCKKAWYCGRECQRRSWGQHSAVCVAD